MLTKINFFSSANVGVCGINVSDIHKFLINNDSITLVISGTILDNTHFVVFHDFVKVIDEFGFSDNRDQILMYSEDNNLLNIKIISIDAIWYEYDLLRDSLYIKFSGNIEIGGELKYVKQ